MMETNYLITLGVGLIPMVIGFCWYHPQVFGTAWMNSLGLTEADLNKGNMAVVLGLSYLFAVLLCVPMMSWSIHQLSAQSLFVTQPGFSEPGNEMNLYFQNFLSKYGHLHRTFGHGAAHGAFAGITIATPIIAIKALFERRSWKYILINAGYWTVTLIVMCGLLCQFA